MRRVLILGTVFALVVTFVTPFMGGGGPGLGNGDSVGSDVGRADPRGGHHRAVDRPRDASGRRRDGVDGPHRRDAR